MPNPSFAPPNAQSGGLKLRWICAALLLAGLVRLALLGAYPLMDTTEGRYGRIAQTMVSTGNWVTPQYSPGMPFWGKPPLLFWISAFSMKAFGLSEFALRLPSFACCVLATLLTMLLATRLHGRIAGALSGLLLATSGLWFVCAGVVITDTVLAMCLTLCVVSIPMRTLTTSPRSRLIWGYLFFVGLAFALLAKGPLSIAIAALAIGAWLAWRRQFAAVRDLPWLTGTLLMAVIATPWHLLAELRTPGFLHYYFVGEHIQRFLVPGWKSLYGDSHVAAPGTIWLNLWVAGLPWTVVIPIVFLFNMRSSEKRLQSSGASWGSYLLCWALAPIVLFTPSRNIMMTYVLPTLPPLAVLAGAWIVEWSTRAGADAPWLIRRRQTMALAACVPLTYCAVVLAYLPRIADMRSQKALVELFEHVDVDKNGELFYLTKMPDSASFYSHGSAEDPELDTFEAEVAEALEGEQLYFVVRKGHSERLKAARVQTELVAAVGKYELYRTPDPLDLKAGQ